MARVKIFGPEEVSDTEIAEIFEWVAGIEGAVPNHFYVELNFPELFKAKLATTKVLWEMGELSVEEAQHIGIIVSRANQCPYCTAAFCTILNYGLGSPEDYVEELASQGSTAIGEGRLKTILEFAVKVNNDAAGIGDEDIQALHDVGLTDKGVVQLVHMVSDFASYNRLNLALDTDYDYRDLWRSALARAADQDS